MNHRSYAGIPVEMLFAEMDRLGIDRDRYAAVLTANPRRTGRWCAVELLVQEHGALDAARDYLDLADEFNDGTPEELGITLADFHPRTVASAAAYAAAHGLAWPPQVGDYDRAHSRVSVLR